MEESILEKIDIINLDFYNLYSEFERNKKMEEGAIDFTKRLIEKELPFLRVKVQTIISTLVEIQLKNIMN